jgi:DnaJ-class molecular chaperone
MYCYTVGNENYALVSSGGDTIAETVKGIVQNVLFYMARKEEPHESVTIRLEELCDKCKGSGRIKVRKYKYKECKKCNATGIINTIIPNIEITKENWMDLP